MNFFESGKEVLIKFNEIKTISKHIDVTTALLRKK